jgi:pimeloyl-ACP methyl ester carboxylesterase
MSVPGRTPVASDGTRYEQSPAAGADAALPPVVLIHGLGLNRLMWQWQTLALAPHYGVITYDLYGHGESPPPPGAPSLSLFAGQLLRLMDELRIDRAAIAGFSLGGMIARRFAMDHGDRLSALAILNSPHRRDPRAHQAIQARVVQARRDGPQATVEAALERWFNGDFRRAHPEVMDLVRRWVTANDRAVYADIYQVLVDGVGELIAPNPPITCPSLVLTGEADDGNSPAMTMSIAAEIPGARTVILPGLRHMGMVEAPALFNRELTAFLQSAAAGSGDARIRTRRQSANKGEQHGN